MISTALSLGLVEYEFLFTHLYVFIWKKECAYHSMGMEVRGQFLGVSSLFLPHGFWNHTWALKFGSECLHPAEPSCYLLQMWMVMFKCSYGDLFCDHTKILAL